MRIVVDTVSVTAREPDDLNTFSVVLRGVDPQHAGQVLDTFGRIDGEHAWLDIAALRSLAPQPRSCSWDERLAKTLADARGTGRMDHSGRFVRAHIENPEG